MSTQVFVTVAVAAGGACARCRRRDLPTLFLHGHGSAPAPRLELCAECADAVAEELQRNAALLPWLTGDAEPLLPWLTGDAEPLDPWAPDPPIELGGWPPLRDDVVTVRGDVSRIPHLDPLVVRDLADGVDMQVVDVTLSFGARTQARNRLEVVDIAIRARPPLRLTLGWTPGGGASLVDAPPEAGKPGYFWLTTALGKVFGPVGVEAIRAEQVVWR